MSPTSESTACHSTLVFRYSTAFFVEEQDVRIDYGEARFVAMGPVTALADRICVVVYTWRNAQRRLISFRKANDEEIERYRASHP